MYSAILMLALTAGQDDVGQTCSRAGCSQGVTVTQTRTITTTRAASCSTARASCHGAGLFHRLAARRASGCSSTQAAGCSSTPVAPQRLPVGPVDTKK